MLSRIVQCYNHFNRSTALNHCSTALDYRSTAARLAPDQPSTALSTATRLPLDWPRLVRPATRPPSTTTRLPSDCRSAALDCHSRSTALDVHPITLDGSQLPSTALDDPRLLSTVHTALDGTKLHPTALACSLSRAIPISTVRKTMRS